MLKACVKITLLMKPYGVVYFYICNNWSVSSCVAEKCSLRGREYGYIDVYISAEGIVKHFKCCDMTD